jgi:hypothetical protein
MYKILCGASWPQQPKLCRVHILSVRKRCAGSVFDWLFGVNTVSPDGIPSTIHHDLRHALIGDFGRVAPYGRQGTGKLMSKQHSAAWRILGFSLSVLLNIGLIRSSESMPFIACWLRWLQVCYVVNSHQGLISVNYIDCPPLTRTELGEVDRFCGENEEIK